MNSTSWKAVTAVAVGVLAVQSFRTPAQRAPANSTHASGARAERTTDDDALGTLDDSRVARLADDLRATQTTYVVCDTLDRLSRERSGAALRVVLTTVRDPQSAVRRCAVTALSGFQLSSARDQLLAMTGDADPLVSDMAVRAVASWRDPVVIDALHAMASSNDSATALRAISALADMQQPGTFDLALAAFERTPAHLRGPLVESIGRTGDPRAIEFLISRVRSAASAVSDLPGATSERASLFQALGRTRDPRAFDFLRAMLDEVPLDEVKPLLSALSDDPDPRTITWMLNAVATGPLAIAQAAVETLTHHTDAATQAALITLLANPRDGTIDTLARYFREAPDLAAAPFFAALLRDKAITWDHTKDAVEALVACDASVARAFALELIAARRDRLALELAAALSTDTSSHEEAVDMLLTMLERDALLTIPYLQNEDAPRVREAFMKLAREQSRIGAEALGVLLRRPDDELRALVSELALGADENAAAYVMAALAKTHDPGFVELLILVARTQSGARVNFALEALANTRGAAVLALAHALVSSPDSMQRQWAADALSIHNGDDSLQALEQLASDGDPTVAFRAMYGIHDRAPVRVTPLLERVLNVGNDAARREAVAFAGSKSPAVFTPVLTQALRDPNPEIVSAALRGLGASHAPDADDWIAWVMNDTRQPEAVRQTAANVLFTRGGPGAERYAAEIRALQPVSPLQGCKP